jgi:hypothetical protein
VVKGRGHKAPVVAVPITFQFEDAGAVLRQRPNVLGPAALPFFSDDLVLVRPRFCDASRGPVYVAFAREFPEPPPELFLGGECVRHQRRRELARFREADCAKKIEKREITLSQLEAWEASSLSCGVGR